LQVTDKSLSAICENKIGIFHKTKKKTREEIKPNICNVNLAFENTRELTKLTQIRVDYIS